MQLAWTDDKFLVPNQGISPRAFQEPIATQKAFTRCGPGDHREVAWGTLDGWRRPRPGVLAVQEGLLADSIEEKPLKLSNPIMVAVENLNTYTNIDQYVCNGNSPARKARPRSG